MNIIKKQILDKYSDITNNLSEVYIFGASRLADCIYQTFCSKGIKVLGFIDNNKNLVGTKKNDAEIYSLSQIQDKNVVIVVASINYMFEIENQLKLNGFENVLPFSVLTLLFKEFGTYHTCYNKLCEDYENNKEEYSEIRNLLCDEKSKHVFDCIIDYRKTFDTSIYNSISEISENQYFENFVGNNHKVFVDGGAFDGDTVIKLKKFNPNYDKIYFFEPDSISLKKAKQTLLNYNNVEYLEYGLSDSEKFLRFDLKGDAGSLFTEDGDCVLKCVAMDDIVKENKTFIKLDIEGQELNALKGAKRLIENGSTLAICVYHKPEDIREIPKLILEYNDNYNFYLRHYTNSIFETVLYAVPKV